MKTFFLTATILFSFLLGSFAQTTTPETPPVDPNAPVIEFNKLVHDYGTIKQNADGNCEFVFTNTGKTPLVLSNVQASCGCTTPYWPKDPIAPGKSETIKIHYDTNRVGYINKTITVTSNASNPSVVLRIKGEITPTPTQTGPVENNNGALPTAN